MKNRLNILNMSDINDFAGTDNADSRISSPFFCLFSFKVMTAERWRLRSSPIFARFTTDLTVMSVMSWKHDPMILSKNMERWKVAIELQNFSTITSWFFMVLHGSWWSFMVFDWTMKHQLTRPWIVHAQQNSPRAPKKPWPPLSWQVLWTGPSLGWWSQPWSCIDRALLKLHMDVLRCRPCHCFVSAGFGWFCHVADEWRTTWTRLQDSSKITVKWFWTSANGSPSLYLLPEAAGTSRGWWCSFWGPPRGWLHWTFFRA